VSELLDAQEREHEAARARGDDPSVTLQKRYEQADAEARGHKRNMRELLDRAGVPVDKYRSAAASMSACKGSDWCIAAMHVTRLQVIATALESAHGTYCLSPRVKRVAWHAGQSCSCTRRPWKSCRSCSSSRRTCRCTRCASRSSALSRRS
jgi:hypothetical protein